MIPRQPSPFGAIPSPTPGWPFFCQLLLFTGMMLLPVPSRFTTWCLQHLPAAITAYPFLLCQVPVHMRPGSWEPDLSQKIFFPSALWHCSITRGWSTNKNCWKNSICFLFESELQLINAFSLQSWSCGFFWEMWKAWKATANHPFFPIPATCFASLFIKGKT